MTPAKPLNLLPHEPPLILSGRLAVLRRVVKPQPVSLGGGKWDWKGVLFHEPSSTLMVEYSPFGQPGSRLWCRETWCQKCEDGRFVYNAEGNLDPTCFWYRADATDVRKDDGDGGTEYTKSGREASPWLSAARMPRAASRITLEVVSVRVERAQDVTAETARAEGVTPKLINNGTVWAIWEPSYCVAGQDSYSIAFRERWERIHGAVAWAENCWCWVAEVRRVTQ